MIKKMKEERLFMKLKKQDKNQMNYTKRGKK